MNTNISIRWAGVALVFSGLVALAQTRALADTGRGSIRAAARPAPAPRAEPARSEPARPEQVRPEQVRPEQVRPEQTHPEPPHLEPPHSVPERVEPDRQAPDVHRDAPDHGPDREPDHGPPPRADNQPHHDWDDNDEDARHFGGFAHAAGNHVIRGQRFHDLPPHHWDIPWHDHHYFFDDTGAFYDLEADGEYVCIQPPVGIPIASLPDGAEPITIGPTTFYYLDGIFYIAQGDGFVVVAPPAGIVVSSLPSGASQTVINGGVIYQFNGFNYQPSVQDGVTVYTVVPQ
jgi:hypothetical protein